MGPYSYREYNVKFNVTFNEEGTEFSWREWQYFIYDPGKEPSSLLLLTSHRNIL
jgi:hypothetical protein